MPVGSTAPRRAVLLGRVSTDDKGQDPENQLGPLRAAAARHGWIVVEENPYYVLTDGRGGYELTDIPAGRYTLKVWHETLGELAKEVVIREGEEQVVVFRYTPIQKEGGRP